MIQVQAALEKHTGIYTVAEAAHYARIPITTLRRWLEANKSGHRLLTRSRDPEERFLNFYDFVQLLAVRAIRSQHHVKLADIYEAVHEAEKTHRVTYPFAREHTTWLFEKKIVIRLQETDELIQLAGKGKGQKYLTRIIEMYLQDLSYDAEGLAEKYRPFPGILMDPAVRFGEPIVESCRITAQTLWNSAQAEGGFTPAAEVHGVEESDVIPPAVILTFSKAGWRHEISAAAAGGREYRTTHHAFDSESSALARIETRGRAFARCPSRRDDG